VSRASRREFLRRAGGSGAGLALATAACAAPPRDGERAAVPLGLNLLLWTPHVQPQHHALLGHLAAIGYDGVEIPIFEGDAAHYRDLGAALDREGLRRTAITGTDAATNPISPDPAVRRAAVERLRWAIDNAHALGAEVLGGPFHSAYKEFVGRGPTVDEVAWSAETIRAVADQAQDAGIALSLEALNRFECYLMNTAAQARTVVDAVGHPAVSYHYDTHHAHIEETDVVAAIVASRGKIGHVHVSENDRGVPGRGHVAWAATFAALQRIGYRGWLTIESFSRLDAAFAGNIHIWRDFFADPWEVAEEGHAFMASTWRNPASAART